MVSFSDLPDLSVFLSSSHSQMCSVGLYIRSNKTNVEVSMAALPRVVKIWEMNHIDSSHPTPCWWNFPYLVAIDTGSLLTLWQYLYYDNNQMCSTTTFSTMFTPISIQIKLYTLTCFISPGIYR